MKEKPYSKDFKVTVIIIFIFGLPAALFDVQGIADRLIWGPEALTPSWIIQFLCKSGLNYLFAWGAWWILLAVTVAALNFSPEYYWKWSAVSFLGVVILDGVGNYFRSFGFDFDFYAIIVCIIVCVVTSVPWVIVLVISIFLIKKLIKIVNRGR
jgi:hypothetical protein